MFLKSIILVTSLSCLLDATNNKVMNILQQVNKQLPAPLRKFIKRNFFKESPKVDGYYNPELFEELHDNLPEVPTEIIGVMAVYATDPFDDLKREVIKELHPTEEELEGLELFGSKFDESFLSILKENKKKIDELGYSMLLTLNRMFFKWVILWRKILSDDNFKVLIEKFTSDIGIHLSPRNIDASVFALNPYILNEYGFCKFKFLIDHELIENPDDIHLKFGSMIEDYYVKGISSEEITTKYFNGDFNRDPLLKAMIQIYDPKGKLKNECLPNYYSDYSKLEPLTEITPEYLENLKKKGPQPSKISWADQLKYKVDEAIADRLFEESKTPPTLLPSPSPFDSLYAYVYGIFFPSSS